jgi:hypothetical protein
MALAIGGVCVVAVAAFVVAMTPTPASGPIAVSATTSPRLLSTTLAADAPRSPVAAPLGISASQLSSSTLLTSFAAFPHAVTSGPDLSLDGAGVAERMPDPDDPVYVRTDAVTYELPWGQVETMAVSDGTVVFDHDGELVAHVVGGELITIVDE